MAKIRVMSNQRRVGRVGDTTYYVRGGEQIARQSMNNSNYGASASRTPAQMSRRVKWANLVNLFKGMKSWQPKAYDFKKKGQTDYNLFMSLNINSALVCLTRDMAMNGCGCWEAYQISRGSLAPIGITAGSVVGTAVTNIVCALAFDASTTIGALSREIIAKNPAFENGDNIAIVGFWTMLDDRGYPYSGTDYRELTLDTASLVTLSDADLWNYISHTDDDRLQLDYQTVSGGTTTHLVAIHTRKSTALQVSTQYLVPVNDIYSGQFMGKEWEQQCIDSYGIDDTVPLDPSEAGAKIVNVTANGVEIRNAQLLSGTQTIRVYGSGLQSGAMRFSHNGVAYTPLAVGDDYVEFVLTDNGTYFIYLGSSLYMTFAVQGIVRPSVLLGGVSGALYTGSSSSFTNESLPLSTDAFCLNYPNVVTESLTGFRVNVAVREDVEQSAFTVKNGSIVRFQMTTLDGVRTASMGIVPEDATKPVQVLCGEFIVFIGNYSSALSRSVAKTEVKPEVEPEVKPEVKSKGK